AEEAVKQSSINSVGIGGVNMNKRQAGIGICLTQEIYRLAQVEKTSFGIGLFGANTGKRVFQALQQGMVFLKRSCSGFDLRLFGPVVYALFGKVTASCHQTCQLRLGFNNVALLEQQLAFRIKNRPGQWLANTEGGCGELDMVGHNSLV